MGELQEQRQHKLDLEIAEMQNNQWNHQVLWFAMLFFPVHTWSEFRCDKTLRVRVPTHLANDTSCFFHTGQKSICSKNSETQCQLFCNTGEKLFLLCRHTAGVLGPFPVLVQGILLGNDPGQENTGENRPTIATIANVDPLETRVNCVATRNSSRFIHWPSSAEHCALCTRKRDCKNQSYCFHTNFFTQ